MRRRQEGPGARAAVAPRCSSLLLLLALLLLQLLPGPSLAAEAPADEPSHTTRFNITIPRDHKGTEEEDAYYCTTLPLPPAPMKLVGVEPLARQEVVHHILLFGARWWGARCC